MKADSNGSSFITGLKIIVSKLLVGFLGIVFATALFFAAAKYLSDSRCTLIDMRGFQLIREASDGMGRRLVPDFVKVNHLSTRFNLVLTKIVNNFKKLSFNFNLSGIADYPGFIVLKKGVDLKGLTDYQRLYFFISSEIGELDKALLSFLKIKVFLDEALVWSMPVSEIGNPTFVEQNIDFLNSKDLTAISFHVGCDLPVSAEQKEMMDRNIHIAIEYIDIR